MKAPLSWIKDFVDIDDIPLEELSHTITMAGLEVEEIHFVGLELPAGDKHDFKVTGFAWDKETIVVAEIREVNPHPDADRLTLCELHDGEQLHTVLTGAPNLFEYKGQGVLEPPLKVAYAKLGAQIYDGHKEGWHLTKIKKAKIRGVESYSMVCSEKELGISEEHEGIIFLPADAPTGMPLADYMGDAVLDISITPNIARNANILGIAREIAALFNRELKTPSYDFLAEGGPLGDQIKIEITEPELNSRFVAGLIKNVAVKPSPEHIQRRLRLIGQRPINNVVDVTNYVMFEIGQPLHAFDYDVLMQRNGGKPPTLTTRTAAPGEKMTTLDEEERALEDFTVVISDDKGAHSLAGIMGGMETEVSDATTTVLLEGAHWNYINLRKSLRYLQLHSEASYRFSRNMHPEQSMRGVSRGLEYMRLWSGGTIEQGLIDEYPLPVTDPSVTISSHDVRRSLGIELSVAEIADMLSRLEFKTEVKGEAVLVTTPDHRRDIDDDPIIARADLMEEVARIYGYENIPETRMADMLPTQRANHGLLFEENVKDILVSLGLHEVITYRMTNTEREARILPPGVVPDPRPHVELLNPIAPDRNLMRKSLLSSVLEIVEHNQRIREHIAVFEVGNIYLAGEDSDGLPDELPRLVIALTGKRSAQDWQPGLDGTLDFYDLKGLTDELLEGLHIEKLTFVPGSHPAFHPGKCAEVYAGERKLGTLGEIHPAVHAQHDFGDAPVYAAALDMTSLQAASPARHDTSSVSNFPPVLEDFAFIVDEDVPAAKVAFLINQTGGKDLTDVRLFDVYRNEEHLGGGKKSLAYALTYQSLDRTLTDKDVAKLRKKIVGRLERELGAVLRA